jgi:hypothetical protein
MKPTSLARRSHHVHAAGGRGARLRVAAAHRRRRRFSALDAARCRIVASVEEEGVMAANVDTTQVIDELEAVLCAGREPRRCVEAMEILRRWQWDRDLDERSRRRSGRLVRLFAGRLD